MRLSHIPLRLATGAFILNSGLSKRNLPSETAEGLQGMAANAVPQVKTMDAKVFGQTLSTGEIALGATLLTPFVPSALAGAALTVFSGALLRMYLNTPGMTEEGSRFKPSQQGTAIAKDIWLMGVGVSLVIDGWTSRQSRNGS